jgi:hypothetical protein
MQIIFLSTVWTIIIDCVAWGIIQPFIAWLGIQFPPQWIQPDLWLYKESVKVPKTVPIISRHF